MSQYADEHYDVYQETERRARRAHVCDACKEPIRPRDRYFAVSWVFYGSAESVKRCLSCQATHLHLRALGHADGMWPSETLSCGEEYTAHWGTPPPAHIARMAFLSPDEKQALVFSVFRTHRGDHFVAGSLAEAIRLASALGITEALTPVPGDVGIPIVQDAGERWLYRSPNYAVPDERLRYEALVQAGLKELPQMRHDFRSAREWAVEYGPGLLCTGEPLAAVQGPLDLRTRRWW